MADQGTQAFDVDNASGTAVGSFNADNTITADLLGAYTEAVLVTKDLSGTVGTTIGDTPSVGSIFNTITDDGIENVYADLTSSSGNNISDVVVTPLGDFSIPTTFDAAQVETTAAIDLPDGDDLDPSGSLDYNGINGLPPVDAAVQGTQTFDYTNADGTTGSFGADVTNTLDEFDDSTETVLVTSDQIRRRSGSARYSRPSTFGDTVREHLLGHPVGEGGPNTITDTFRHPSGTSLFPTLMTRRRL